MMLIRVILFGIVSLIDIFAESASASFREPVSPPANETKLIGRQAGSFIHMLQPTYRFASAKCSPGTVIGKVTARDVRSAQIVYVIDSANSNIAVNQKTGQLVLINFIQSGDENKVVIRATSASGSASAEVTYGCGSFPTFSAAPAATASASKPFAQSSYVFITKSCLSDTIVGTLTSSSITACTYASLSTNPFYVVMSSGQIRLIAPTASTETLLVRADCGTTSGTATVVVQSACPTTPMFTKPAFAFTLSACTAGQAVGYVNASNAMVFVVDPPTPFFSVAPTTGAIKTTTVLTSNNYAFNVRAYSNTRATTITLVRVIAPTCLSNMPFRFFASSYNFGPTNCSANTFIGQVGTSGGTGTTMYSVDNPTGVYSVGSKSGVISALGVPKAGTLTIRATNGGKAITVPVIVNLDACEGLSATKSTNTPGPVINPAGPVFSQRFYVMTASSCDSVGAVVGQVFATSRRDSDITYFVDSAQVQVDNTSGVVSLKAILKSPAEKAVVVAKDSAGNSNSAALIVKCAGMDSGSDSGSGSGSGTDSGNGLPLSPVTNTDDFRTTTSDSFEISIPGGGIDFG